MQNTTTDGMGMTQIFKLGLVPGEIALFFAILVHEDLSTLELAILTGQCRRSVFRFLNGLRDCNVIKIESGLGGPNKYRVCPESNWKPKTGAKILFFDSHESRRTNVTS